MSAAAEISDLMRDLPSRSSTLEERLAWHVRKAELLSRIADEAVEEPGFVDVAAARAAAEAARATVADLERPRREVGNLGAA